MTGQPAPGTTVAVRQWEIEPRTPRPLPPVRGDRYQASWTALPQLAGPGSPVGLMLGRDRDRAPVLVRAFRPEPTRMALVGGSWAARIAVFRALALGARVVVFGPHPQEWEGFGRWATGRDDRVAVLSAGIPVAVAASCHSPVLFLYDVGPAGPTAAPQPGPWQARLTLLRELTPAGAGAVASADLVLLQRLTGTEIGPATGMLRLTGETAHLLQVLRDDMLAVLGGGADRYLWVSPTSVEQQQFGAPTR